MDILTHLLTGLSLSTIIYKRQLKYKTAVVCFGALIPDVGEIIIQKNLNHKYNESFGVYDSRTSDIDIASNLHVTYVYDTLHSLVLPFFVLTVAYLFIKKNSLLKQYLSLFSIGLLSHVLLDSFTHGRVWALKLFFPISNIRFPILVDTVGNWWDWKPKFTILYFELPVFCLAIWIILIGVILVSRLKRN